MHASASDWLRGVTAGRHFHSVLEFGSRNINGSAREVIAHDYWHGIDLEPGECVNEVADARFYGHDHVSRFDLVVCAEVLEHCKDWRQIVANAQEHGHEVLITCAGPGRAPHSAVDGGSLHPGEWYENINPMDLASFGFSVEYDHRRGDVYGRWVR